MRELFLGELLGFQEVFQNGPEHREGFVKQDCPQGLLGSSKMAVAAPFRKSSGLWDEAANKIYQKRQLSFMGKNFPRTKQNTKSSCERFWWTELGPLEESRSSLS